MRDTGPPVGVVGKLVGEEVAEEGHDREEDRRLSAVATGPCVAPEDLHFTSRGDGPAPGDRLRVVGDRLQGLERGRGTARLERGHNGGQAGRVVDIVVAHAAHLRSRRGERQRPHQPRGLRLGKGPAGWFSAALPG
jgi:hypothetical protein